MKLTTEEVRHVAALARLGMTDAELELMRDQLSHILESFDALGQVDTDGVEPTRHSIDVDSVMRDDKVRDSLPREDVLSNAPLREGDFVRVRAVLGDH
jgi:aspartyl-tRNA(Asn)/glutamyl-tRNA(Gln) amidotransferase subunit C